MRIVTVKGKAVNLDKVEELIKEGKTIVNIAGLFDLSPTTVRTIIDKHLPELANKAKRNGIEAKKKLNDWYRKNWKINPENNKIKM